MIGRFNELSTSNKGHKKWNHKDAVFRVGIGTSSDKRKDAFRVMKNGNVVVNGDLTVNGFVTHLVTAGGDVMNPDGKRRLADAGVEETLLAKIAALEAESAQAKEKLLELEAKVAQILASGVAA